MKLVEKKCPNCGASISFKKEDKEVECNYCHAHFDIENDNEDAQEIVLENFKLHAKTIRRVSKGVFIVAGIIFIFILVTFFLIFFKVIGHMH